jgi:hypothetical protein
LFQRKTTMKKTTCLARTFVLLGLVLVALVAVSSDALAQGGNKNPGVIPPNAKYKGLTYGEWAARWWQEALSIPVVGGQHPSFPVEHLEERVA